MRTLRGRIGLALVAFGMITLVTVGGTLWVALRDLHRDATLGSLAESAIPYGGILRSRIPGAFGRDADGRSRGGSALIERIRQGELSGEDESLDAFLQQVQEDVDPASLAVILIQGQTTFVLNPVDRTATTLAVAPHIDADVARGQVATGSTTIEGIGDALYAATALPDPLRGREPLLLMLAKEDDSARLASADLVRALTLAGLALLVIGIPIAVGLSASITRPLRRLSAATQTIAAGGIPEPLPTTGPVEVAAASAAFNAMAAEVDATREAQRQLLADIRHDLRTPLTVIGGFSEALKDGTAAGDDAVRAADAISDEAERLGRMLDDLDQLTMPGSAEPSLRLQVLDGLEVARGAVDRFTAEAVSREQSIELLQGATSATVMADRDVLDRILGNLIANALGHAPSPGGHIRLDVTALDSDTQAYDREPHGLTGKRVVLAVQDDGPGIPVAALPHVFDRFYRADPSRSRRGSGLGLAIVSDLAEALGGRAFAENLPDGGARVGIALPGAA